MDRMLTLRTLGARARAALLVTALATVATSPGQALAATSGGWSPLGHGATSGSSAINTKVETLLRVGTKLYVGGDFTNAAGIAAADHIAIWNGSAWSAVGAGLGDAPSAVYAIAVDPENGHVYRRRILPERQWRHERRRRRGLERHVLELAERRFAERPVFALAIVGRTLTSAAASTTQPAWPRRTRRGLGTRWRGWSAMTAASGDITGTVSSHGPGRLGRRLHRRKLQQREQVTAADFVAR